MGYYFFGVEYPLKIESTHETAVYGCQYVLDVNKVILYFVYFFWCRVLNSKTLPGHVLSPPDHGHDLKLDQWHIGAAQGELQDTQCHPCDHDNVAVSDFLDCRALQDWPRSRPPRLWED